MAITGNGQASKEQVAGMLKHVLNIQEENMLPYLDATDALGAAYCHYLESSKPEQAKSTCRSWKDFVKNNSSRVKGDTTMLTPAQKLEDLIQSKRIK